MRGKATGDRAQAEPVAEPRPAPALRIARAALATTCFESWTAN